MWSDTGRGFGLTISLQLVSTIDYRFCDRYCSPGNGVGVVLHIYSVQIKEGYEPEEGTGYPDQIGLFKTQGEIR